MKNRTGFNSLIEYLFVASLILTESTMYGVMKEFYENGITDFTFRIICLIITFFLIIISILEGRRYVKRIHIKLIIVAILFFALYLIISRYNVNAYLENYFIPFILFLLLVLLHQNFFERFFNIYDDIIYIISFISLIFYFGGTILKFIPSEALEYYNNGAWNQGFHYFYLNFINEWQTQEIFGKSFVRNVGIFMEAPGFAFPLIMSLWWELFEKNNTCKRRIVVFLITIITTFSTKALGIAIILLFVYLYSKKIDKKSFWKKIRPVFFPLIFVVGFILGIYILKQKVLTTGDAGSWFIRKNDIFAAYYVWKKYPILGAGFYNLQEMYNNYPNGRLNGAPTMGILNILAYGGVYTLVGYIVCLKNYLKKVRFAGEKYNIIIFLALFITFLATSNNQYSYTVLLLLAMGYIKEA